jgi:hypothetical protein
VAIDRKVKALAFDRVLVWHLGMHGANRNSMGAAAKELIRTEARRLKWLGCAF